MKILKIVELNAHEIECVSGGCLLEYVVKKTIEELFRNISEWWWRTDGCVEYP